MWTAPGTGAQNLGALPGAISSVAYGVSDTTPCAVVGFSGFEAAGGRAFRWTAAGGMRDLGVAAGWQTSSATGVSSDGTVVIGRLGNAEGSTAAIWHPTIGMMTLEAYLAGRGAPPRPGVVLIAALGIAPAGRYIAVEGRVDGANRGLLVDLGDPCWTDLNHDRTVDGADLAELLSHWGDSDAADFDANGTVDGADLGALLLDWGACG